MRYSKASKESRLQSEKLVYPHVGTFAIRTVIARCQEELRTSDELVERYVLLETLLNTKITSLLK